MKETALGLSSNLSRICDVLQEHYRSQSYKFCDTIILCSKKQIVCHSAVLQLYSSHFRKIMDNFQNYPFSFVIDCDYSTVKDLIDILYFGITKKISSNVLDLAVKLEILSKSDQNFSINLTDDSNLNVMSSVSNSNKLLNTNDSHSQHKSIPTLEMSTINGSSIIQSVKSNKHLKSQEILWTTPDKTITKVTPPCDQLVLVQIIPEALKSPADFYVKLIGEYQKLHDLIQYEQATLCELNLPKIFKSQQIVAVFRDNFWHRCKIISSRLQRYKVFYLDIGIEESVESNRIMPLSLKLLDYPAQAVPCYLNSYYKPDSEWCNDEIEYFRTCCLKITDHIKACFYNGIPIRNEHYPVDLNLSFDLKKWVPLSKFFKKNDKHLSEIKSPFLKDSLSSHNNINNKTTCKRSNKLLTMVGYIQIEEEFFTCAVVEFVNPFTFYLQCTSTQKKRSLEKMQKNLQYFFENNVTPIAVIKDPKEFIGSFWAAKYEDDNWYRVKVINFNNWSSDICVNVCYIDYGNIDTFRIHDLHELPEQFTDFPPFALKCSLAYIEPISDGWNSQSLDYFKNLTSFDLSEELFACVIKFNKIKEIFEILLWKIKPRICINLEFVRKGLAYTSDSRWLEQIESFQGSSLPIDEIFLSLMYDKVLDKNSRKL